MWRVLQGVCVLLVLVGLTSAWPVSVNLGWTAQNQYLLGLVERHLLPASWSAAQCRSVEYAFGVSCITAGVVGLLILAMIMRKRTTLDDWM